MKNRFIQTGRAFYGLALIVYGIQQFIYADFRNVLFPPWQHHLPLLPVWAYIFGIYLVLSGVLLILDKYARNVALIMGITLLSFFCFLQVPYELISEPNKSYHLGLWVSALKELALAGGAFVIAGTYPVANGSLPGRSFVIEYAAKIIPYASIFFSITMICFGITHFMYAKFVVNLVPAWFPDHLFWTYFAAVALIGSGVFIILNIRMRIVALLLGIMIFVWFLVLHLPLAYKHPYINRGNELSSSFDALAFSGIALVIAFGLKKQKWIEDIEQMV